MPWPRHATLPACAMDEGFIIIDMSLIYECSAYQISNNQMEMVNHITTGSKYAKFDVTFRIIVPEKIAGA